MIFTSITFVVFFLAVYIVTAWLRSHTQKVYFLLFASYVFYGWWNVAYLGLIFLSSMWGWGLGKLMIQTDSKNKKKLYLVMSLVMSLATLAYFKYANFFIDTVAPFTGSTSLSHLEILLPVGISFFLFQNMSYTIDLYRERIAPCDSVPRYLLFVSFFPQLVAGPIVRASEFLPQLNREIILTKDNAIFGGQIFFAGLIQKTLIADNLSHYVDPVFHNPEIYSSATLWAGLFSYSIQIFCDFSGYSLMAIGVARILGFELPKNFDMPYVSCSITEFWRRWHITLSTWLRDYLYISLGGNRKGEMRTRTNIMVTMLLGGLWHGASWNFVLWGGMHGSALIVHKYWMQSVTKQTKTSKSKSLLSWWVTLLFVMMAWVPFRCQTWGQTLTYYDGLFINNGGILWLHTSSLYLVLVTVVWHIFYLKFPGMFKPFDAREVWSWKFLFTYSCALMSVLLFAPLTASPFIYFQF